MKRLPPTCFAWIKLGFTYQLALYNRLYEIVYTVIFSLSSSHSDIFSVRNGQGKRKQCPESLAKVNDKHAFTCGSVLYSFYYSPLFADQEVFFRNSRMARLI